MEDEALDSWESRRSSLSFSTTWVDTGLIRSSDIGPRVLAVSCASETGMTLPLRTVSWRVGLLLELLLFRFSCRLRVLRYCHRKSVRVSNMKKPRSERIIIMGRTCISSETNTKRSQAKWNLIAEDLGCKNIVPSPGVRKQGREPYIGGKVRPLDK